MAGRAGRSEESKGERDPVRARPDGYRRPPKATSNEMLLLHLQRRQQERARGEGKRKDFATQNLLRGDEIYFH